MNSFQEQQRTDTQTIKTNKKNSEITSDIFWDLIIQHKVVVKQRHCLINGLVTCNDTWNLVIGANATEIELVNKFNTKSNKSIK